MRICGTPFQNVRCRVRLIRREFRRRSLAKERLLGLVRDRVSQLSVLLLSGTNLRVHQKGSMSTKGWLRDGRDSREAYGRSRRGLGITACVIADGSQQAIAFRQAHGA